MAVLLPNATLGVRRRVDSGTLNAHGERQPAYWGEVVAFAPGRTNERADGGWALGVDPLLWPVRVGDLVVSEDGYGWLVESADLIRNNWDPAVDWVRISGQQRSAGGTEPGGGWFVGRFTATVERDSGSGNPTEASPGLWTGYGPPPATNVDTFPAQPGDEYIDLLTGTVYTLGEEPIAGDGTGVAT